MTDPMDELRRNLQDTADAFRPALDPADLAATSRRRRRTSGVVSGVAAAAVLACAVFVVPGWTHSAAVIATPASTPPRPYTFEPMNDWKLFVSKEYPITFGIPKDWSISGLIGRTAGCSMSGCELTLLPPKGSSMTPVVLARNGFEAADSVADSSHRSPRVLVDVPELTGWGDAKDAVARPISVARSEAGEHGEDFFLAVRAADGSVGPAAIAVGPTNPLSTHREALFTFGTALDNLGGSTTDDEERRTVMMILASARLNLDYDPTTPVGGVLAQFDSMSTPVLGAVAPDESWRTLTVAEAGIRMRYPDGWKLSHDAESQSWAITAPSGYQVKVGLAMDGNEYFAHKTDSTLIGRLDQVSAKAAMELGFNETTAAATGPVEVRWVNGGQFAASAYLALSKGDREQSLLHFGSHRGVQVLGVGTADNPTPAELDQVVAILASVQTVG